MRSLPLLVLLLALAASPAALAHNPHGPCTTSRSLTPTGLVHVDLYNGDGCGGATARVGPALCGGADPHVFVGVHTPILHGRGCETGVVLEPMREGLLA